MARAAPVPDVCYATYRSCRQRLMSRWLLTCGCQFWRAGHVRTMAKDSWAHLVLMAALERVDDTALLRKHIVTELMVRLLSPHSTVAVLAPCCPNSSGPVGWRWMCTSAGNCTTSGYSCLRMSSHVQRIADMDCVSIAKLACLCARVNAR